MSDKDEVIKKLVGKPRCPKCKSEIETLSYNSNVSVTQIFSIDSDGVADYSVTEDYGDHEDDVWKCPECYTTLFDDEDEAVEFLQGKS